MRAITRGLDILAAVFIIFMSISVRASGYRKDSIQPSRIVNYRIKRTTIGGDQQSKLSNADKNTILEIHNGYRKKLGASNMEYMKWDSNLENLAETVANTCDFSHHHPQQGYKTYAEIGQNLWHGPQFDVKGAVNSWYKEKEDYNYDTAKCSNVCGHYTQMVWSATKAIGCALVFCSNNTQRELQNTHFLVCNYGPAGNFGEERPYLLGESCTRCLSGKGECYDGLCRDLSTEKVPGVCKLNCLNCGTVDMKNCSCKCPVGWSGPGCTDKCQDRYDKCSSFDKANCAKTSKTFGYMILMCKSYCELCKPPEKSADKCEPQKANFVINGAVVRQGNSCDKDGSTCSFGTSSYGNRSTVMLLLHIVVCTIFYTDILNARL